MLGLITRNGEECGFIFSEADIGKTIISRGNNYSEQSRQYLFNFYNNAISLNSILEIAGAELVTDKKEADIDLSPENLEKDTILELLA